MVNAGFDQQHGFELVEFQVIIDYERLQTFGFLGFIRMWKVVKIWICLLHISLFLYKIPDGGYKELWNKSTFNGVIGSVALYCSDKH